MIAELRQSLHLKAAGGSKGTHAPATNIYLKDVFQLFSLPIKLFELIKLNYKPVSCAVDSVCIAPQFLAAVLLLLF
jgi:hypothetical protein